MALMNCGLNCEIIEQDGKDIVVRFEDGTRVKSTFASYAMHKIDRPVDLKEQHYTISGRACYIKNFYNYQRVDVTFPNGDYINDITFRDFCMNKIDDSKVISYMDKGASPIHYLTYLILSCYFSNVYYNTNGYHIYIANLDIGIFFNRIYSYSLPFNPSASKVFTIADKDAKVVNHPKNNILRIAVNSNQPDNLYLPHFEQTLKVLATNLGIDSNYITLTEDMIKSANGVQKKLYNYMSYLFIDNIMNQ